MPDSVSQTAADRIVRAAGPAGATPCVLLMFGELTLKGRKRSSFAAVLERNLRRALRAADGVELQRRGSSLLAPTPPDALARTLPDRHRGARPERRAAGAAGRAGGRARRAGRPSNCSAAQPTGTFAVRPRRREKTFPVTSMELSRLVGAAVKDALGLGVDLSHPDVELHVDAYERALFVAVDRLRGRAACPSGRAGGRSCCCPAASTPRSPPTA